MLLTRRSFITASCVTGLGLSGCLSESRSSDAVTPSQASSSSPATPVTSATSQTDTTPVPTATTQSDEPRTAAPHVGAFKLWNDDTQRHAVKLVVQHDGKTILDAHRTLEPGGVQRVENPIDQQGTYQIVVRLDEGPERRVDWVIESCSNHQYQQIFIGEDTELVIRAMRETIDPAPTCDTPTPATEEPGQTAQ